MKGRSDTKLHFIDEAAGSVDYPGQARGDKMDDHFGQVRVDKKENDTTARICRVCEHPKETGIDVHCMMCNLIEASMAAVANANATVGTPMRTEATGARPYYNCGRCTYRQPRVGPDVCIMCLKHTAITCQQLGKKKAHQGAC